MLWVCSSNIGAQHVHKIFMELALLKNEKEGPESAQVGLIQTEQFSCDVSEVLAPQPNILILTTGRLVEMVNKNRISLHGVRKIVIDNLNDMVYRRGNSPSEEFFAKLQARHNLIVLAPQAKQDLGASFRSKTPRFGRELGSMTQLKALHDSTLKLIFESIRPVPSRGNRTAQLKTAVQTCLVPGAKEKYRQLRYGDFGSERMILALGNGTIVSKCFPRSSFSADGCSNASISETPIHAVYDQLSKPLTFQALKGFKSGTTDVLVTHQEFIRGAHFDFCPLLLFMHCPRSADEFLSTCQWYVVLLFGTCDQYI